MPWMVDQRHYLDVEDNAAAKRIARFMGSIVEGLTGGWDDPAEGCTLTTRCIGRVGRRRCPDRVVARIVGDDHIEWSCLTCGDFGEIHHWQGTPWDLTGRCNHLFPRLDAAAEIPMTFAEHEAVCAIDVLDAPAQRVLAAARVHDDDLMVIDAPRSWAAHLVEFIASEANHTRSKKRRALYETLLHRVGRSV